jgi:outer membrane protein OmpA-like peptidoglycan-associated protein
VVVGGLLLAGVTTGCSQNSAPTGPSPAAPTSAASQPQAPSSAPAGDATNAGGADSGATDRAALQAQLDQLLAAAAITFLPDQATLTSSGAETVDKVAALLAPATDVGVRLTGHAARTPGDPGAAQQLSDQRAQAEATVLAAKGVAADRIQTQGASDTAPKADAAASRRVEIQLT